MIFKDLKIGDRIYSNIHGSSGKITKIQPYDRNRHGTFNHRGNILTVALIENVAWFCLEDGCILGYPDDKPNVRYKGIQMFKPIVEVESETLELPNLFTDESIAKSFSEEMGFTYIGKGSEVEVPRKVK